MTAVAFYHLTATDQDRALAALLDKVHESDHRAVVVLPDTARAKALDDILWTFKQAAFIPHGAEGGDLPADRQPIWLTTQRENPNQADIFVTTDGRYPEDIASYERILDVFDGANEEMVTAARARWQDLKNQGHEMTYYKQAEDGSWQKK